MLEYLENDFDPIYFVIFIYFISLQLINNIFITSYSVTVDLIAESATFNLFPFSGFSSSPMHCSSFNTSTSIGLI